MRPGLVRFLSSLRNTIMSTATLTFCFLFACLDKRPQRRFYRQFDVPAEMFHVPFMHNRNGYQLFGNCLFQNDEGLCVRKC